MRKLALIVRHEFRMATANKAFVILTVLGPFLILAVTVLPTFLANNPAAMSAGRPVAISSAVPGAAETLAESFKAMGVAVAFTDDPQAAKAAVLDGSSAGYVVVEAGWPDAGRALFYSKTGVDATMYASTQAILGAFARELRIGAAGIDPALVRGILADAPFEVLKIGPEGNEESKTQDDFMEALFVSLSFVMVLYMTVLLYGQMIGASVVREKTSKTVEVMLSSVTSRELMFGKIFGLGLAGLLQYGVWISVALALVKLVGPAFDIAVPASISPENLGWLLVFFLLAFFLYSSAYAALGAASEDEHHLGQLAWPLLMFLIVPLVMVTSFIMSPDSALATALSIFPMTAPLVMLIRVLVSDPPAWQLAISVAAVSASVIGMALLASKIFRTGILMTGKRARLGEILRWVSVK
ncbi:MAG TPA: ABC transporter permease [Spirochaetales bacterium]|nr:ABC transporter permease [Spirochaetales bacterium]